MQNRYTKRYSAQPVIRKRKRKTTGVGDRLPARNGDDPKDIANNECWQRYGERGHLYIVDGKANWSSRAEECETQGMI